MSNLDLISNEYYLNEYYLQVADSHHALDPNATIVVSVSNLERGNLANIGQFLGHVGVYRAAVEDAIGPELVKALALPVVDPEHWGVSGFNKQLARISLEDLDLREHQLPLLSGLYVDLQQQLGSKPMSRLRNLLGKPDSLGLDFRASQRVINELYQRLAVLSKQRQTLRQEEQGELVKTIGRVAEKATEKARHVGVIALAANFVGGTVVSELKESNAPFVLVEQTDNHRGPSVRRRP